MADLVMDLLEALEPFDITMSSWLRLLKILPEDTRELLDARTATTAALHIYLADQVTYMQFKYGKDACDDGLAKLFGVHDTLIRAGRLLQDPLGDRILIYAAHLGAMTSYGPAVWDRASKIVLAAAMNATEKELSRRR